jgi:hypothetical protein
MVRVDREAAPTADEAAVADSESAATATADLART